MREYGFAIVTNVISSEECSELTVCQRRCAATSFALDTVCHQAFFARDLAAVASTDSPDFATMPGHFQKSFCTHLGLMHGEMSWRCRLHPNVRLVYAALYQSDELVTGVDNVFFTQVLPTNMRHHVASHYMKHRIAGGRRLRTLFGHTLTKTSAQQRVAAGTCIKA